MGAIGPAKASAIVNAEVMKYDRMGLSFGLMANGV